MWLPLLKLISPAGAYVRQHQRPRGRQVQRGRIRTETPDPAGGATASETPRPFPPGPSHWEERIREVQAHHREAADRAAEELLRFGAAEVSTTLGPMSARLVRFWNGTAILDCQLAGGRSFALVDRRELRENALARLSRQLMSHVLSFDHGAHPHLWGPRPTEPERVPSPGGWTPPPHMGPGWDWTPPGGAVPRPDLIPRWVRIWYRTPLIDRFAHAWMWAHGGFQVARPAEPAG